MLINSINNIDVKKIILVILVILLIIYANGCNQEEIKTQENKTEENITDANITDATICSTEQANTEQIETKPNEIEYKNLEIEIQGLKQVINIIEFVPNERIKIIPVFSYNHIFGFEKLSEMIKDINPYGAINGGFHSAEGRPYGMVGKNGVFLSETYGKSPLFVFNEGKYDMEQKKINFWFNINKEKIKINKINASGYEGEVILYTSEFGTTTRTNLPNISLIIEDNILVNVLKTTNEQKIPQIGNLISIYTNNINEYEKYKLLIGKAIIVENDSGYINNFQVYECGSWLIKAGEIVAPNYDGFVGSLLNRDPRTAIGIKEDGKIVLITADGRQPDVAVGFTAKEFASFLKGYGLFDAAMLDGGSSTEMIVEGIIVNNLSYTGRERPLAGGIVITFE